MKKFLISIMAIVLVLTVFTFAGCGVKGTYTLTSMTFFGEEISGEDLTEMMGEYNYTLELKGNDEVVLTLGDETITGTWSQEGDVITISYAEDPEDEATSIELKVVDNTLVIDYPEQETKMIFTKQ